MKLENKVAVITGAASGMGKAEAELFAKEGAIVAACDVNEEGLKQTVEQIQSEGYQAEAYLLDISNKQNVDEVITKILDTHGHIDILCNTAGIFDYGKKSLEADEALWDKIIDIDLKGAFLMCNAVLPSMIAQKKGNIINVASVAGLTAGAGGSCYTAAKHGLVGYTKALAHDYGADGIRANAICPGAVLTGLTAVIPSEVLEASAATIPARRSGLPEDVAKLALFLATDESDYIYGAAIPLDGGQLIK